MDIIIRFFFILVILAKFMEAFATFFISNYFYTKQLFKIESLKMHIIEFPQHLSIVKNSHRLFITSFSCF